MLVVKRAEVQVDGRAGVAVEFQQPGNLLAIGAVGAAGNELASAVCGVPIGKIGQRGHPIGRLTAIDRQ